MKTIRGSLITMAVALLAVAAFAATSGASSMSKLPPCTKKALSAGLKRGPAAQKNAKFTGSFACASGWAYSGIVVGGDDAVAVYQAKNGVWVTVNRAKPCRTHAIPKKIYKGACTTS
jgi:hypothetical protein